MAGGLYGADVAQLRALGARLDQAAAEIERAGRILAQDITTTTRWQGPDASVFRNLWSTSHHPQVASATAALRAAARTVRLNADQQEQASRADGGTAVGAAAALAAAMTAAFGGAGVSDVRRPPSGTDPGQANTWWRGLSDDQQKEVIAKHPEWIGNRDGIPAWARDQANRALIDRRRQELEAERDRLKKALDNNIFGKHGLGFLSGLATNEDRQLQIVQGKLDALDRIERAMGGDRQLLLLDIASEPVRAAIAVGDVDNADHVAVIVPGTSTTVAASMGDKVSDAERLQQTSEQLMLQRGSAGTVAVVAWIGYDCPDDIPDALNASYGQEGGAALASFGDGLRAINPDAHLTALGHSYGSLVVGVGVQATDAFDSMVVFGSPGLGTSDSSDLRIDSGQRFVLDAKNDFVADAPMFGTDPTVMEGMSVLSTSASGDLGASEGHSDYLTSRSTSQYNMAAVVSGNSELVIGGERESALDSAAGGFEGAGYEAGRFATNVANEVNSKVVHGVEYVSEGAEGVKRSLETGVDVATEAADAALDSAKKAWGGIWSRE